MIKKFLHVGCGQAQKKDTTKVFISDDWDEVRLDIDPSVNPDIIGDILDLNDIKDNSYDAVFSSHNIEHVFMHEVKIALNEFKRVLKDDGFLLICCPDISKAKAQLDWEPKVSLEDGLNKTIDYFTKKLASHL